MHRSTPPTTQEEFDIQQPIPDPKPVNDLQSPNSPTFVTQFLDAEALLRSLSPTPASRQSPLPRVNSQEPLSPETLPHNPRSPSPLPPLPPLDSVDEETSSPDSAEGPTISPTRPQRIVRFKSRVRISCMFLLSREPSYITLSVVDKLVHDFQRADLTINIRMIMPTPVFPVRLPSPTLPQYPPRFDPLQSRSSFSLLITHWTRHSPPRTSARG